MMSEKTLKVWELEEGKKYKEITDGHNLLVTFEKKDDELMWITETGEGVEEATLYSVLSWEFVEIEEKNHIKLERFETKELVSELKKRTGVNVITVAPHEDYYITTENLKKASSGPTVILEIRD